MHVRESKKSRDFNNGARRVRLAARNLYTYPFRNSSIIFDVQILPIEFRFFIAILNIHDGLIASNDLELIIGAKEISTMRITVGAHEQSYFSGHAQCQNFRAYL